MSVWPPLLITVIPVARWQYQNFPKHVLLNSTFYPCHFSHINLDKRRIIWNIDERETKEKGLSSSNISKDSLMSKKHPHRSPYIEYMPAPKTENTFGT